MQKPAPGREVISGIGGGVTGCLGVNAARDHQNARQNASMSISSRREQGNAVLIVLFAVIILATLLTIQVVATRANVLTTDRRTQDAQLNAQAAFSSPRLITGILNGLPQQLAEQSTGSLADGTYRTSLSTEMQAWLSCGTATVRQTLLIAGTTTCGGTPTTDTTVRATQGTVVSYQVPLQLKIITKGNEQAQRTRLLPGELRFANASTGSLPITAYQVLANVLGTVPADMIFDGPVQVNGQIQLAAGRSAWPGGLTSEQRQLRVGNTTISVDRFGGNGGFPCDQSSANCPNFVGGIGMGTGRVDVPDVGGTAGLNLPSSVREVVLYPQDGGTGLYVCTTSSCDQYVLTPTAVGRMRVVRVASGVAVPSTSGRETPGAATESTVIASDVVALVQAPGDLQVRALTPAAAAYAGTLSIIARQNLIITSSLLAQRPACTTYAVATETLSDLNGGIRPANCGDLSSPDALGLASQYGSVFFGDETLSLVGGNRTMTVQGAVLAPRGTVQMQDSRLSDVDWIGSVAAGRVIPDVRMRLAHDPRFPQLPGFPTVGRQTPGRIVFRQAQALE